MLSKLCVRASDKNTCEDSIFVKETNTHIIGCLADGCSRGIKSSFASQLLCYVYESNFPYGYLNDAFIFEMIYGIRRVAGALSLDEMNLLSTFIPFIYNKDTKKLKIRVFGDGYYQVNGVEYNVKQNNTPNYIGYHINRSHLEIQHYLYKYPELIYKDVESFIICSDGIDSLQESQFTSSGIDPVALLLSPPDAENILERRYNILKRKKITNGDDLSIITYKTD